MWNTYFTSFLFILVGNQWKLKKFWIPTIFLLLHTVFPRIQSDEVTFFSNNFCSIRKTEKRLSSRDNRSICKANTTNATEQDWTNLVIVWNRCSSIDFIRHFIHEKGNHIYLYKCDARLFELNVRAVEKKNRKTYYRLIRFAKQQQHQKELLIKTTKKQVAVFKTIFFYKSLQHKETSKFILRKIKLYDQFIPVQKLRFALGRG